MSCRATGVCVGARAMIDAGLIVTQAVKTLSDHFVIQEVESLSHSLLFVIDARTMTYLDYTHCLFRCDRILSPGLDSSHTRSRNITRSKRKTLHF